MARPFSPKVLTASRLIEGDVVYLGPDQTWVSALKEAILLDDETEANLALEAASQQVDRFVGPYLADAVLKDDKPAPAHFREGFRATGPSNYHHGKQTESSDV